MAATAANRKARPTEPASTTDADRRPFFFLLTCCTATTGASETDYSYRLKYPVSQDGATRARYVLAHARMLRSGALTYTENVFWYKILYNHY
ncbi:hypothetical protein CAL20_14670 [Bordetella genomosp. 4]|uniref:Uncharacterized protein n=1 Tax=Bordetella genomosp. 4 TaxID=463044 RepID=A0A261U444_9BORD|nr:hypothetical protein CAL20_14670 [Bordetella genomosp. 4]